MSAPNPGSPEAIESGCLCPRMDNANGQGSGMLDDGGEPTFWIAADCPMHGSVASEQYAAWLDGLPADVQNDPALPAAIRELTGRPWDETAAEMAVAYVRRDRQARDRLDGGAVS
jgi:hypothetical protein